MRRARWWAVALLAIAPAAAQDSAVKELRGMSLADVLQVDISTGTSKFLHQAPAIAYVITAEDIARLGARNVLEVLEAVPGIDVHLYQGAITNAPLVDVRGSFTQRGGHVLFLRDGKPLRVMGNMTMPEIFKLPVQFVDRIEIARGPGSAVYGADALSGTVNIITRKKPMELGGRVGEPRDRAAWGGYSGTAGPVEWALALSHSDTTDDAVTRSIPLHSTFTQAWRHEYGDVDLKLRAGRFSSNLWALDYYKDETGHPGNPRGETLVGTQHRHFDVGYDADLSPTSRLGAVAMYTRFRGQRFNEVIQGTPLNGKNAETRATLDVALTETRFSGHRLRFNAGAFRERRQDLDPVQVPPGAPPPTAAAGYRNVRYVAAQDEWGFAPDWELTAGVRADRYSDYKTIFNPRLGLVWTINPKLTAKLLLGEAFRAPVFNDTTVAGRTPERLRNAEIAIDYRPSERWSVIASTYRYRAKDLAEGTGPNTVLLARDGEGIEVTVGWNPAAEWRLEAGVAHVEVKDHDTGRRVPLSARETAKAALNWRPTPRWNVNLRWEGYFDRERAPNDPRPPLEDFGLAHLAARLDLTRNVAASVVVHNLFDKRAWAPYVQGTAQDVQLLERSAFLQLEYRF